MAGDRTPSAPSTPEPADSADSPSHKLVQDAVHSAVAEAEEDAPAPAPALPPPTLSAAADLGANGPVPPPQPGDPDFINEGHSRGRVAVGDGVHGGEVSGPHGSLRPQACRSALLAGV